jgi:hypothetical protein
LNFPHPRRRSQGLEFTQGQCLSKPHETTLMFIPQLLSGAEFLEGMIKLVEPLHDAQVIQDQR